MKRPRKYEEMSEQERIEQSDKIAVMRLEEELRENIKHKLILQRRVEECVIKKGYVRKLAEDWIQKFHYWKR